MVNGCCAPKCRYTHLPCDNCDNYNKNAPLRQKYNLKRINKQVRQDASVATMKRKVAQITKVVGQSANPSHLAQAGGPGDLTHSIQKCGKNGNSYNDGNALIACLKNMQEFKIKVILELIKNMVPMHVI